MAAFKRKRGAHATAEKTAKNVKFVVDDGNTEQDAVHEIVVPAPVSMVSSRGV